MLVYALSTHEPLYGRLCSIESCDMSEKGHIVSKSNKKTVGQNYRREKNGEQLERSSGQADERSPRPRGVAVSKHTAYAWISDNLEDPQNIRRVLWTKHHLPAVRATGEEGIREERMEHEY